MLGERLGGPPGERLVIGFEGGHGYGPERISLGFTHSNTDIAYVELDPWYILGGSFGVAVDTGIAVASPVLGIWEGIPLNDGPCSGWHPQLTLAGRYRYAGRHELYVTLKADKMAGTLCFD